MRPSNLEPAMEAVKTKLKNLNCLRMCPNEEGISIAFKDNQGLWLTYLTGALLESNFNPIIIVAKTGDKNILLIELIVEERPIVISANGIYDSVDESLIDAGYQPATKFYPYVPGDDNWVNHVKNPTDEELFKLLASRAPSHDALMLGVREMFFEMIRLWFDSLSPRTTKCH